MKTQFKSLDYPYFDNDTGIWNNIQSTDEVLFLYGSVSALRSAIDVRARAIGSVPYTVTDKQGNEVEYSWLKSFRDKLMRLEQAYCLYGVGYLEILLNSRDKVRGLQWLSPPTVWPHYTSEVGLSHYTRTIPMGNPNAGQTQTLLPDEVIVLDIPTLYKEAYYGIPLAYTAMSSASTIAGYQRFASEFFRRGALRTTVLQVGGVPTQQQIEELRSYWQKFVSGVKQAYNTIVMRDSVNPVVVGDGMKELQVGDVLRTHREDVLAVFGVPYTLVYSNAANYATASEEKLTFYDNTVCPQLLFYEEQMNEQFFNRLGLTFTFRPERLEIYQQKEIEKAQSLNILMSSGIVTREEAREMLGLPNEEPMEREREVDPDLVMLEKLLQEAKSLPR